MTALERFVVRHQIFVEAHEFDDGLIFVRERKGRAKKLGFRRNFRVSLRREKRRIHFYTMTLGSAQEQDWRISIDFPEQALLRAAEAALEYEDCGRDLKRYATRYPSDPEAGHALFGYGRSESRLLERLLGNERYRELLRIVGRHGPKRRRPVRQR
jgi:hypothetical protein